MDEDLRTREQLLAELAEVRRQNGALQSSLQQCREECAGLRALAGERQAAEAERDRLLQSEKAAKAEARRHADHLTSLLEKLGEAVTIVDGSGNLLMRNLAAEAATGFHAGSTEEVQRNLRGARLSRPDGSLLAFEEYPFSRLLRGESFIDCEAILQYPNLPERRRVFSGSTLRDQDGKMVLGILVSRDVTELTELDRLKDQFILVAAHELKTPLTIMRGYAQALLRRANDIPPERRKMADAIIRGADRMDRIVQDLLDISRLQSGHLELSLERVALHEFVEQVVDRMGLMAPRHQMRIVRADPVVVFGDPGRLEQVLANLLDNAARYSPRGGEIAVAVGLHGEEAVVSVRDRGVGIPRAKQPRTFQRFYRAHTGTPHDYGGMGVGLYISREIVGRHGGRMWFESEEDRGSTFYFSLPVRGREDGD